MYQKANVTELKADVQQISNDFSEKDVSNSGGGGRALNFFAGRGVRPGFPKCGACELTFASEKGGL